MVSGLQQLELAGWQGILQYNPLGRCLSLALYHRVSPPCSDGCRRSILRLVCLLKPTCRDRSNAELCSMQSSRSSRRSPGKILDQMGRKSLRQLTTERRILMALRWITFIVSPTRIKPGRIAEYHHSRYERYRASMYSPGRQGLCLFAILLDSSC